jgi:hypothetical protein
MAFENIQIAHGNFTVDASGGSFFTIDHTSDTLIEKSPTGTVIFNYLLDTPVIEVQSLQHDGVFFWSLERQGTAGFRVRKWLINSSNVLELQDEFSFASDIINNYDVNAMAVEYYVDSLDNQETVGTSTFDVVDGGVVRIGDRLVVGPSTSVGFEGEYSTVTVINKVGDYTLTVSPALDKTFSPGDPVYLTRSFFVFSDTAPGGLPGALYKFRFSDGFFLALSTSNLFNGVSAATFFKNSLMFVRAGEIIWLDPDSLNINKSQAIDNQTEDRAGYFETFDLTGFSNTIYRLEQQTVFFNGGQGTWDTESWAPLYNYNTSPTVPEIYFVAVKADPPVLHNFKSGIPTEDLESEITVTVLDQFRTPVSGRTVDLTSTGGPLSSIQETTDANGQVRVTYTADVTVGNVTITADVT